METTKNDHTHHLTDSFWKKTWRNKMNKKDKEPSTSMKTIKTSLIWLLRLFLALLAISVGIFLWAYLSTGTSLVARGIVWGDSDYGDLYRFPARLIRASSNPVLFDPGSEDLVSQLKITDESMQVVDMPFETFLEITNAKAFVVLHGNQLLYEGYFNGSDRNSMQTSFSAAKSFTSTLVGIAINEGFIHSLNDPITKYLPELLDQDPRFQAITIHHLITMSSGLRWDRSDSNPFSDDFITYYSPDLRSTALDSQIIEAPGLRFVYNDYNPLLVGLILERATGLPVSDYMQTRLWQPMGAEADGSWSLDSEKSGFEKMFVGVNGRAIDLIRLGWLFLNNGRNGAVQVVPESWVQEATRLDSIHDPSAEYQYYWWIDPETGGYYAEGDKCQFIYIYPKVDLVLARFGTDCGGYRFGVYWMRAVAQYLGENLTP